MSTLLWQLVDESSKAVSEFCSKPRERLPDIRGLQIPLAEAIPQPEAVQQWSTCIVTVPYM